MSETKDRYFTKQGEYYIIWYPKTNIMLHSKKLDRLDELLNTAIKHQIAWNKQYPKRTNNGNRNQNIKKK